MKDLKVKLYGIIVIQFIVLSLLKSAGTIASAEVVTGNDGWLTYTGAWFKIDYPTNFLAEPSGKSLTDTNGCDGVKFVEENAQVAFYVYSPQSAGLKAGFVGEITPQPDKEFLERDITSAGDYIVNGKVVETNAVITRFVTIAAKDGSYRRTYEIIEDSVQSSILIFGFRYPDTTAFGKYKPIYNKFRLSLVRYSD